MRDAALTSALDKIQGPSALARKLGITPTAVIQWERVPAARAIEVERYTGISRHKLRPDIFGPAPVAADVRHPNPAEQGAAT